MSGLLLRDIAHLVTFDADDRELRGVDLRIAGGCIAEIGRLAPAPGEEVLDASGLLVLPGLINAHQHLYQVGLRCIAELERATLGPWLAGLGRLCMQRWHDGHFTPEAVAAVARAGMVESLLGGVTTVVDQHYFFPGGVTAPYIEATIEAATEVGIRLQAGRGTMTMGHSDGGMAPDEMCQTIDEVVRHSLELIAEYHDPDPMARIRIDLAPCGPHVDHRELFAVFAEMAAEHEGVGLHTHLYEQMDTEFCRQRYGRTPWEIIGESGWHSETAWLAHMVDAPLAEIADYAAAGVGIVHLIAPDLRMGFGLAPVREWLEAGCTVGFGTTGSASNDGCNQLGDLRLAALAHRLGSSDPQRWLTARELLAMATRGSARCLGRPALGVIEPGAAADLAAWDITGVDRVGVHDPVIGLLMTGLSDRAELVTVAGVVVVRDGRCVSIDEATVAAAARAALPPPAPSAQLKHGQSGLRRCGMLEPVAQRFVDPEPLYESGVDLGTRVGLFEQHLRRQRCIRLDRPPTNQDSARLQQRASGILVTTHILFKYIDILSSLTAENSSGAPSATPTRPARTSASTTVEARAAMHACTSARGSLRFGVANCRRAFWPPCCASLMSTARSSEP